jgi:hypothetical protein
VVLTVFTGIHMYKSFKKLLGLPSGIPPSLEDKLPSGFWADFGAVYYFNPIKTMILVFGFYVLSILLMENINKKLKRK